MCLVAKVVTFKKTVGGLDLTGLVPHRMMVEETEMCEMIIEVTEVIELTESWNVMGVEKKLQIFGNTKKYDCRAPRAKRFHFDGTGPERFHPEEDDEVPDGHDLPHQPVDPNSYLGRVKKLSTTDEPQK